MPFVAVRHGRIYSGHDENELIISAMADDAEIA
jgi:hypothetical protein